MSDALAIYRDLEAALDRVRRLHNGLESSEEDAILEQMDLAWERLSAEEHAALCEINLTGRTRK